MPNIIPTPVGAMLNGPHMFTGSMNSSYNGGVYQSASHIVNYSGTQPFQRGMDILAHHIAPGAFHNSRERSDPPRCYPNTREAIQAKIEAWVKERPENGERLVLWIYGPAGAGKSAIAQSIAELCEALLAASFFFSRTSVGRSDSSCLVATIVWQLIVAIPEIREAVLSSVERDSTILSRTPATQMKHLVVDPLNQISKEILEQRPRLIIIDGLDECLPPRSQDDILNILATSVKRLNTPLYFLIASRPHHNIRNLFMSNSFKDVTDTLPLEYDYQSTEDIRNFLVSSFKDIHVEHTYLPRSWPSDSDIEAIIEKSSGHFIYPATVMRYVDSSGHHGHEKRLAIVLGLQSSNTTDTPFAMLDALYLQIFQSIRNDEIERVLEVLTALICLNLKLNIRVLEEFFDYRPGELACVLRGISALVDVPEKQDPYSESYINIHHASLPDFLFDRTRSQSFYLDSPVVLLKLARRCIQGNRFRSSTVSDNKCYVDPAQRYARIFSGCILESPITEDLRNFLLEFNLWDNLPRQFALLCHNDICDMTMNLLKKFQDQCENSDAGWTHIYGYQLHCFDTWIKEIYSALAPDLQILVIIAFNIYLKFRIDRSQVLLLEDILTFLGSNMDGACDTIKNRVRIRTHDFIDFFLQRLPIIFGSELPQVTKLDYTDFAYLCAVGASKQSRRPNLGGIWEMSPFGLYLAATLDQCVESEGLFKLLKGDEIQDLGAVQRRMASDEFLANVFPSDHPMDVDFSQYIKRCERVFNEELETDNTTTVAPPEADTAPSHSQLEVPGDPLFPCEPVQMADSSIHSRRSVNPRGFYGYLQLMHNYIFRLWGFEKDGTRTKQEGKWNVHNEDDQFN